MSKQTSPFDPNEFAEWLIQGLKETVSYRVRQTLDRDRWIEYVRSRMPNKNQVIHLALKKGFEQAGFKFEELKQGSALFYVIRKTLREVPQGQPIRRFVFIPGLGDSPGSWVPFFTLSQKELARQFDEVVVLDFPGYMGFLSHHEMVPSMSILLNVVKMVCDLYPPHTLMGHSLGGWLAGKTAQDFRAPIEHLVTVAPSGLIPPEERKVFGDFIVRNQELTLEELLELIVYDAKKFAPLLTKDFKDFYEQPEIKSFVESVEDEQFIDASKPFIARRISVIWGDQDRFVPTHWIRYWVERYGEHLDAYLLKNTGHIPQMERPIVLSQVLLHALMSKEGTDGMGWKKIQSRRSEWSPKSSSEASIGTKLLT
jgi:pimeloyl-ACP methyl ester carboxylesterase